MKNATKIKRGLAKSFSSNKEADKPEGALVEDELLRVRMAANPAAASMSPQERKEWLRGQYDHWLQHGSDDLRKAWVSVSQNATTGGVTPWSLQTIVAAIKTGAGFDRWFPGAGGVRPVSHLHEKVKALYEEGGQEAEKLNTDTLAALLAKMNLEGGPDSVEAFGITEPRGKEGPVFFTELTHAGRQYSCPDGYVYHLPEVMGKKHASETKKLLPCVTLPGCFNGKRKAQYLQRCTGLYVLDLDSVQDLATAARIVCEDRNVALAFYSVTGSGLAVCVRGPLATTPEEYARIYRIIAAEKTRKWQLQASTDEVTCDVTRLRFFGHHPETYVNWDAEPFDVPIDALQPRGSVGHDAPPNHKATSGKRTRIHGSAMDPDTLREMLTCIPADDRGIWLKVLAALKMWGLQTEDEDLAFEIATEWSETSSKYDAESQEGTWDSLNRGAGDRVVTIGTLVHLARENGWKGKPGPGDNMICLPSGGVSISDAARNIFEIVAPSHTMYSRGGVIVELKGGSSLAPITSDAFRSCVEKFGKLFAWRSGRDGKPVLKPTKMSRDDAEAIMTSTEAHELLPQISSVVRCPVLVADGERGVKILPRGYHPDLGGLLITEGGRVEDISLDEAVENLKWIVDEFCFQDEGDRSRAIADLITPALRMGGIFPYKIPVSVAEANDSQSGKGYRHELVCAIYKETTRLVAKRNGGVGSTDESFASKLVSGRPFICFDNVRGKMDSQYVESFLTAPGPFGARIPHHGEIDVDPSKFIIQASSNGVEMTPDFANRSSICRILKRPGFQYRDTLGDVIRRQPVFLGSVFAVIREWVRAGKPRTTESRHDYREWCQSLDWIVRELFKLAPLMQGHVEAQRRVSNPSLIWLRAVALAIEQGNKLGQSLTASELATLCQERTIDIPSLSPKSDEGAAMRLVGSIMRRIFDEGDEVAVEGFVVQRGSKRYRKPSGDWDDTNAYSFNLEGAA